MRNIDPSNFLLMQWYQKYYAHSSKYNISVPRLYSIPAHLVESFNIETDFCLKAILSMS